MAADHRPWASADLHRLNKTLKVISFSCGSWILTAALLCKFLSLYPLFGRFGNSIEMTVVNPLFISIFSKFIQPVIMFKQ